MEYYQLPADTFNSSDITNIEIRTKLIDMNIKIHTKRSISEKCESLDLVSLVHDISWQFSFAGNSL